MKWCNASLSAGMVSSFVVDSSSLLKPLGITTVSLVNVGLSFLRAQICAPKKSWEIINVTVLYEIFRLTVDGRRGFMQNAAHWNATFHIDISVM